MTTERIALTQPIESRSGSFATDSYSANVFFDSSGGKRDWVKRPGLQYITQITPVTPPAYTQAQGLTPYNGNLVGVINNTVYQINPSTPSVSTIGTTSASTSQSYFVRTFLDSYLFIQNKVNGYLLTQGGSFSAIGNTYLVNISIDNPGLNYSSGITLSLSASGAAATATVTNGLISTVTLTNPGSGLSSAGTCTVNLPATQTPTATGFNGFYEIVVSSATGVYTGMYVTGTGVAPNAYITSINGTTLTLNIANVADVSGTVTIQDLGNGAVLTPALNSFPSGPFVSGTVFLDNYVFIGTTNNRIYNCNLGDPKSWNALSFLSFEQTTDTLVGIAKHLNYLIAFGATSTQFFYDAGNYPGSPLALAASYTNEIGCANGDSIVATSNTVLWVGTTRTYGKSVYIMDGVSPVKVSTSHIDRHLEADDLVNVRAYCYKTSGHTFYVLTLIDSNKTLVYDIDEKMWYTWTQWAMASNDQPNPGTYYEMYFRPTFYAELNNIPYCLDDDRAILYQLNTEVYQDNGQPIYCRSVTNIMDNGTTKRKFYGRLEIVGDKVAGTMYISHSGNDYVSYSVPRPVNLNATRSQVYLSGADRRRSWQFLCTDNVPLRLDVAEIDFRIGEMDQEQGVGGNPQYKR